MGFASNIATSFRLSLASMRLLWKAPGVMALPFGTLAWTALWAIGPASFFLWFADAHPDASVRFWKAVFWIPVAAFERGDWEIGIWASIIQGYVMYAIWLTIVLTGLLYFLTVGMHVATQQIRTPAKPPSMANSFRVANQNLGRLFLLALWNATVFAWVRYTVRWGLRVVLSPTMFIPVLGRIMRRIIMGTVGMVLTAVSYLMLPILVYERAGPVAATKSAWNNIRQTWSGLLIGSGGLFVAIWGLMNFFAMNLFMFLFEEPTVGAIFAVVTAGIAYAFASSASAAMRATLYWYATTGETPEGFQTDDLPELSKTGSISGNPIQNPLKA